MKKTIYLILFFMILQISISYAVFIDGSYKYKGVTRKYSIYVPDIYNTHSNKVPLLLGLHGYGDDIANFKNICMSSMADTANYICVYAEALPWLGANAWNSGAGTGIINVNSGVDDVGFLNGLVDTVILKYRIDTSRMYVFGFSFGGFMTDRIATENASRFAAVCNVSGLHGNFLAGRVPSKGMPYLKFHGTDDPTIGYDGTQTIGLFPGFGLSAENTVNFWVTQNQCTTPAVIDSMPNTANDGLRFVRYTYNNGKDNSKVIFYKVINGIHRWYGLPTNDISYCQTIWSFFRQYSRQSTVTTIRNNSSNQSFKVYPNPSDNFITLDVSSIDKNITSINLFNTIGSLIFSIPVNNEKIITIDTGLEKGFYLLQLRAENEIIATERISIQ